MSGAKDSGSHRGIEEPPGYPYPSDHIIHSSVPEDFTPGEDSWFAVARLEEQAEHDFNGRTHRNPYRLTIHTPVRGSVSFLVKEIDAMIYIEMALAMLADSETMGGFDRGEYVFNLDYYVRRLPDGYEVERHQDTDSPQGDGA